jgi:hypothetical protein
MSDDGETICDWCGERCTEFTKNKMYVGNVFRGENTLCKWCYLTQCIFNAEKVKKQSLKIYKAAKETAHKLLRKEGFNQ